MEVLPEGLKRRDSDRKVVYRRSVRAARRLPKRLVRGAVVTAVLLLAAGAFSVSYAALSTGPTNQKTWYWQNPLPQGNQLLGVDAPAGSDVWAVGYSGVVLHSSDDGAQWEPQDAVTQVILRAVDFVDSQHGWVVGDSNIIKATTDGGSTWTTQTAGTIIGRGVSMATTQAGWIVGSTGAIRKTVNGGASWTTSASPTAQQLNGVSTVDSTHAWAVGNGGVIITAKNGAPWALQSSPTAQGLNAVSFVDTQTGYAVGAPRTAPAQCTVLKTTDGGSTWTTMTVTYLDSGGNFAALTNTTMRSVSFRDANTGWIAGDTGLVLFTQDGGVSWTSQKSGTQSMYGVTAGDGAKGHLVGVNGVMLRTDSNGQSWLGQQQGTTARLNGASWTGPSSGIVVGAGGLVMKTEDAGDSWSNRTVGPNDLYAVKFADATDGWIVGSGGSIRKSTNAGSDWVPQSSGTTQTLFSVTAVNPQTAWAVGGGGTILKTVDGGATWVAKTSGTAAILYDVFFLDSDYGWAVGASGTVRRTVNGGETWTSQPSGLTSTIYSVQFTDISNGWLTSTAGRLRHTTNGGTSWTAQTTGTTKALYGVEMADANHGWAVGGDSAGSVVLHTVNGGTNWTNQEAGFKGILRQVTVASSAVAGIVGDGGAMRRTFDSGASWELTGFWTVSDFRDLAFATNNEGWAVGAGSTIAHTQDGGQTWGAQQAGGTASNYYAVDFVSAVKGWAVGSAGQIRTFDTGALWTAQTSGVTAALWGVDMADSTTGWVVGAAGTVLKTVNGGSTWTTQTSNVPATTVIYGVSAVDTQTAFAWGTAGTVLKTTTGGSTWTTQTISIRDLQAGAFVDSQTGWVAGASGVIYKTIDGGATWTPQTANAGTNSLWSLYFSDSQNGYLVGAAGTVRRTTNGGTTWTTQLPGTSNILYAVGFTDADHGWLVGQGGTIMRTTDLTPPTTTIVVDPPAPNGNDGWFLGKPQITFVSNEPGLTYYSWTSATGPFTTFSVPVVPPHDGQQTIHWYSVDPGGNKEAVQSMTGKVDATPPSTPSTPSASVQSATSALLTWSPSVDAASGVSHYEVYDNGSLIGTSPVNSATLSLLTTETVYSLTIAAVDVAGNVSDESGPVVVSTLAPAARPPVAVYVRTVEGLGAFVNWGATTGTVDPVSYRVWRSTGGGPFSAIATLTGEASRSYDDTSAPIWSTLRYAVSVLDARGEGAASESTDSARTAATVLPPVVSLSAKNTQSVLITWTPLPVAGLTGYHVYRSTTSTSLGTTLTVSPLSPVPPVAQPSFHDTSTADYTEYWYRVAGIDALGQVGAKSSPMYIRTDAGSGTVEAPHGAYTTDSDMCALCHSVHAATGEMLLTGTSTDDAPLCLSCHDGTSASDVRSEYTSTSKMSRHAVSVGSVTGTLQCSGCHGVHSAEQTDTVKGLLLAGNSAKSGNAYCYVCHGTSAENVPGGDLTGFEGSAHAKSVPEPPTGTKVVCLSCHVAHSSAEPSLYPYATDDRCLGCHDADIAPKLSGASYDTRHNLLSADTSATGSRLACANCHEPHTSSATTPCVDPDNPSTTGGMQASDALCLRCHDGTLPTSAETSGWAQAPLAASGLTTTTDLTAKWAASFHGAGSSVDPQLRSDMGYAKGDTLTCQSCHDPHGSVNKYALLQSVRAKTGTMTVDALLVQPVPGGGVDLRFFCASCHVVDAASHPGPSEGGADLNDPLIDCTASGCHTHSGTGL